MSRLGFNRPWKQQTEEERIHWRQQCQAKRDDFQVAQVDPGEMKQEWRVATQGIDLSPQVATAAEQYSHCFRHLWVAWKNAGVLLRHWGYQISHPLQDGCDVRCDHWVWFQALFWGQSLQTIRERLACVWLHPDKGLLVLYWSTSRYLNTEAFYQAVQQALVVHTPRVLIVAQNIRVTSNYHYLKNEIANFRENSNSVHIQLIHQARLRIVHLLQRIPHQVVPPSEVKRELDRMAPHRSGQVVQLSDLAKLKSHDPQCFLNDIQPGDLVKIQIPREGGWYTEYRVCQHQDKSSLKLVERLDTDMRKAWE